MPGLRYPWANRKAEAASDTRIEQWAAMAQPYIDHPDRVTAEVAAFWPLVLRIRSDAEWISGWKRLATDANAEVLALREKLGASQDLAELLGKLYEGLVDVVHAVVHEDIRHGAQEAIELLLNSLDGRDLLPPDYPELPAPTEGDG